MPLTASSIMPLTATNMPIAVVLLALLAILLGFVGRRSNNARILLTVLAPIGSAVFLEYFLFQAQVYDCAAVPARCEWVAYTATWGPLAWIVMTTAMALSLAPLLSLLIRNRLPSAVAAVALLLLVAAFTIFLWSWVLPVAALFAAAIAGPPPWPSRGRAESAPD